MTAPRWQDVARATGLMGDDGVPRATVFAEMSALAARTGAVNLGQGFPDVDGPASVARAAADAIAAGANQYPPGPGIPALRRGGRRAPGARTTACAGTRTREVLVTAGATEALAADRARARRPGRRGAHARAVLRLVRGRHRDGGRHPHDRAAARDAPTASGSTSTRWPRRSPPRTRLVLVNTPHNPTGTVLTRDELAAIARLAVEHDALVVTDEVYEHLVLDGSARAVHVPIATLPGMAERTLTISSAGKTFSFTGWKIGWVTGPEQLVTAVRTVKQFLTYVNGAPFQPAVAFALRRPGRRRLGGRARRTRCPGVATCCATGSRTRASRSSGRRARTSCSPTPHRSGYADGAALCRDLPGLAGVVGVPVTAFTHAGSDVDRALRSWVRFTFVKRDEVLTQAVAGLHRLHRG